jgi:hypothetical protein
MVVNHTARILVLICVVGLAANRLAAQPPGAGNCPPGANCPPDNYPKEHYWFPILWNWHYRHHCKPTVSVYAPDRHPGVPFGYVIQRFPCLAVEPAAMYPNLQNQTPPSPDAQPRSLYAANREEGVAPQVVKNEDPDR